MDRDLDAEIVRTIFKWSYISIGPDARGENRCEILYPADQKPTQDFYDMLPLLGKIHEGWHAPRYSSDLRTAIELAKHVRIPLTIQEMPLQPETLSKKCLDWWLSYNSA